MKNIIITIGSARPGRVADKVLQYVQEDLATRTDINATVVDLAEANLPFFNNEVTPSTPGFHEENEAVQAWSKAVSDADAVVMITAEYNHFLPAVHKNAIDWLYNEWADKPIAIVGYGFYGGAHSIAELREIATVTKFALGEHAADLALMKDLNPDGTLLDEESVRAKIKAAIDEIA